MFIFISLLVSGMVYTQNPPLKIKLEDVLEKIPGKNGEKYAAGMSHGSMSLLVYAPRGKDEQ